MQFSALKGFAFYSLLSGVPSLEGERVKQTFEWSPLHERSKCKVQNEESSLLGRYKCRAQN